MCISDCFRQYNFKIYTVTLDLYLEEFRNENSVPMCLCETYIILEIFLNKFSNEKMGQKFYFLLLKIILCVFRYSDTRKKTYIKCHYDTLNCTSFIFYEIRKRNGFD